jgi:IS1 family transposase
MNKLDIKTRAQIIALMVEGNSIRSITRITGCSKNTVAKLLVDCGRACIAFHNYHVTGIKATKIQCDEIWSFVYAKEKNVPEEMNNTGAGDCWTWTAIDSDSKMLVSWYVGDRDLNCAKDFMMDLASRLANRVQLTTDGYKPYLKAVEQAFNYDIDYALLIKHYEQPQGIENERKYSPVQFVSTTKTKVCGNPDARLVSTSHVERNNLTMRMSMRRFTRLTNGFSKKIENHVHAIAIHSVYYNFCRIHSSLRVTPAMEAGLTTDIMSLEDIVRLTDK